MVKNLPANAGDMGSVPAPGRFHMPRGSPVHAPQLVKPTHLEPVPRNERSHCNEKPAHHNQRKPTHSNADPVQPKLNKQVKMKKYTL